MFISLAGSSAGQKMDTHHCLLTSLIGVQLYFPINLEHGLALAKYSFKRRVRDTIAFSTKFECLKIFRIYVGAKVVHN